MRLPITLGSMEPNSGVIATLPHFLQRLEKLFKFRSSHILEVSVVQFESTWNPITDKWEWKSAFKCGVAKLVDGSRKRIDGVGVLIDGVGGLIGGVGGLIDGAGKLIDRVGMLIGRAVDLYNYLPNEVPAIPRFGGVVQRGIFQMNFFRRVG